MPITEAGLAMTEDADSTEVDLNRSASLESLEWRAAVCITAEGEESLWLLWPDPQGEDGCCCAECAPHEQLGPYIAPLTTRQKEQP
jgi:hypothetical protein